MSNNQEITVIEVGEVELDAIQGSGKAGFGGEKEAEREARIRTFFAENKNIIKVGKLLSVQVQGKTIAAHLIAGAEVGIPKLSLGNGVKLEPKNVQTFKLTSESVNAWGCVACHSAHGTAVGSSPSVNLDALMGNKFYYAVDSQTLFTISDTCYGKYVKASNLASQIKEATRATAAPATPKAQEKTAKK